MSKLSTRLPNLRNLHVMGLRTQDFILALPKHSLKELVWRNYEMDYCHTNCTARDPPSLELVLQHQGGSLEALDVRLDETTDRPVPPISVQQAAQIVKLAPNLQRLTLNLARKPDSRGHRWPWEELQVLAGGLTELTHLVVMFEFPSECQRNSPSSHWSCKGECLEPERYATPLLNATGGQEMVDWLQRHKVGRILESVRFISGDWTEGWDGPLYLPDWMEYKRMWVKCLPNSGDNIDTHTQNGNTTEQIGNSLHCEGESVGLRLSDWENHCAEKKWKRERNFRRGWWNEIPPPYDTTCRANSWLDRRRA